jgi:hypothetical protein
MARNILHSSMLLIAWSLPLTQAAADTIPIADATFTEAIAEGGDIVTKNINPSIPVGQLDWDLRPDLGLATINSHWSDRIVPGWIQQLAAATGDGVRIAKKCGQHAVAAVAESHGFQTGIQAALLLIQQAVEQDNGCFHLIGRHFQAGGIDNHGNGLVAAACQALSLAGDWIDGGIEE